jgi:hypothetical protein
MTKPDTLFRVTGWLTNYETAIKAGMTLDQANTWATQRTLNTFPNYAALPGVLREASRLGIMGSFIAFQHEVYRNFGWNVRYMVEELGSGNPALQARGMQRLGGLVSIGALTLGGGMGGLMALMGLGGAGDADDERNRLFRRWYAAPYERDAVLAFSRFDDKGVSYSNTSYLLPQITMQELAQAAMEGGPEEGAQRVMARLWEQFGAGSVNLSPILEALTNRDRAGRTITHRDGVRGVLERADKPLQTIAEAGFAEKVTRLIYAYRDAKRRGRTFSFEEEFKRLVGIRATSREWETLVRGRYSRFAADYQGIREDANQTLGENLPGAPTKAIEEANARIARLREDLREFEAANERLGIPAATLRRARKASAFVRLNLVRVRKDGQRVEADPLAE